MAPPILLVPGTQATTLVDQNGRTVYNAVRASLGLDRQSLGGRLPRHWSALLSLKHDPEAADGWAPSLTSLEPGTTLTPDRVVRTPYQRLHQQFDVKDWPYDWRADLRWNALRLLDWLCENPRPSQKEQGERWSLVGHSQGALLIVLAARLAADHDLDFAVLVSHVVLIGAPLAGTLRALEVLLIGRPDLGTRHIDRTRAMALTWPSLYQMLPPFDAIGGGEGLDPKLWQRACETHALLADPLTVFDPGVHVTAIFAEGHETPQALGWSPETGYACRKPRRDRGAEVSCRELDFSHADGDGLVPLEATLAWCGGGLAERSVILGGPTRGHALMCDDEDVVERVRQALERR